MTFLKKLFKFMLLPTCITNYYSDRILLKSVNSQKLITKIYVIKRYTVFTRYYNNYNN